MALANLLTLNRLRQDLNWPCVRVNLDSHISRIDLIGKDAIVLKDGKQITQVPRWYSSMGLSKFSCTWYLMNMMLVALMLCLLFNAFLEAEGRMNFARSITWLLMPNKYFRLFATANTIGLRGYLRFVSWHSANKSRTNGSVGISL